MFSKPILMKCGHFADCIMPDVPFDGQFADVAACCYCFTSSKDVNQAACAIADKQPTLTPLPKIKKNRGAVLLGTALCILTVIILIVSL